MGQCGLTAQTHALLLPLITGRVLHKLEGHTADVMSLCVTPDGETIVSGSADTTIRLWKLSSLRRTSPHGHVRTGLLSLDCSARPPATLARKVAVWFAFLRRGGPRQAGNVTPLLGRRGGAQIGE